MTKGGKGQGGRRRRRGRRLPPLQSVGLFRVPGDRSAAASGARVLDAGAEVARVGAVAARAGPPQVCAQPRPGEAAPVEVEAPEGARGRGRLAGADVTGRTDGDAARGARGSLLGVGTATF